MPSTYTLNNGIELIATGEQSGTWGDTTNTNLSLVDTALDGQVTVTLPSAGSSGSPNLLLISDGAASDGRNRMVIFNDGSDLGATAYVRLDPNDAEKIIYVRNDLSGSRSIILFQGTYNASNDYEVPAGMTAVVFFDGAGSGAVAANVFNNAHFDALNIVGGAAIGTTLTVGTSLNIASSTTVDGVLDEDDMTSDSPSKLATQQSIKAYVDSQVTAQDLDFAGDSGTGAVDLDSQTLTIAGTSNEIETSASGQTLTVGLPDDVTINTSLSVDTIGEKTSAAGVTVDSVLLKDGGATLTGNLVVDTDTLYVDSTNNLVGFGTDDPDTVRRGHSVGVFNGGISTKQKESLYYGMNVSATNYFKIFEKHYVTTSSFSSNAFRVTIVGGGSTGGNGTLIEFFINFKQQGTDDYFRIVPLHSYGGYLYYKWDASGGDDNAGLLEIWGRTSVGGFQIMGVHVESLSGSNDSSNTSGVWQVTDTGSTTAPSGSSEVHFPLGRNSLIRYNHDGLENGIYNINDQQWGDIDFRVSGSTSNNLFYVDSGANQVLVGTNSGDGATDFEVEGSARFNERTDAANLYWTAYYNSTTSLDQLAPLKVTFFHAYTSSASTHRWYKVALLPTAGGATGPQLRIRLTVSNYTAAETFTQEMVIGNRNGTAGRCFNSYGMSAFFDDAGIKAFDQTDGTVVVYVFMKKSTYRGVTAELYSDGFAETATVYPSNEQTVLEQDANPTGTLSFDSTSTTYNDLALNVGYDYAGSRSVVVNETAADIDFRVEGTTAANLIRTDAANDRVGIKYGSPLETLHVYSASSLDHIMIDGPAAINKDVAYTTNQVYRIATYLTSDAESGSNAGSNFAIARYADDGSYLGRPITVERQTGDVGINQPDPEDYLHVKATSGQGAVTIEHNYAYAQPNYAIKFKQTNNNSYMGNNDGGGKAWEARSNAFYYGSGLWDLDAGTDNSAAIMIEESTGAISFSTNTGLTAGGTFTPNYRLKLLGQNSSTDAALLLGNGINTQFDGELFRVSSQNTDRDGGILIDSYFPTLSLNDNSGGGERFDISQDGDDTLFKQQNEQIFQFDDLGRLNGTDAVSSGSTSHNKRGAGIVVTRALGTPWYHYQSSTYWVKLFEYEYNSSSAFGYQYNKFLLSGSGATNGGYATGTLIFNAKQQSAGTYFSLDLYNTKNFSNRIAYLKTTGGGGGGGDLIEVWGKPYTTYTELELMLVHTSSGVFAASNSTGLRMFMTSTGSTTQPSGSTLLAVSSYPDT